MKEIVLYEDEEVKKTAEISENRIRILEWDKDVWSNYHCTNDMMLTIEDIKKIYHAIEEEG